MLLGVVLSADVPYQFGEIHGLIPSLLRDFVINGGWILSDAFSVFIEMVISLVCDMVNDMNSILNVEPTSLKC